ncbi:MAG: Lpg1974 family pore-forming outer membrane protein [Gemmataceae bacterium]|nr:Lpg1974 family pore-forming outer membrane protein [Gemmataceae bacterium]
MLRKQWLALAAAALCDLNSSARAEDHPTAISAPVVHVVDNHHQPEHVRSGIMGGASIYFIRPYINDNVAFTTTTGIGTAAPQQTAEEFDWNYHVSPLVWLGWTSECGVGFRARYFYFDQDSEGFTTTLDAAGAATTVIAPPAGLSPLVGTPARGFQSPGVVLQGGAGADNLSFGSNLHIQTLDGEATCAHEWCRCGMLFSVGGRYLQMRQDYLATLVNTPAAGTSETASLSAGHNFYGGGPTMSLYGRFEFGRSGLAVFGSARGSFLVGNSKLTATLTETITDPVNGNQASSSLSQSRDNLVLPIGELEGGVEYSRALGRTRVFVRGAAVNHTYFDAGSASGREDNLSLFGAQVSFGLNY